MNVNNYIKTDVAGKMIIAYRCPECGAGVLSMIDPIQFVAGKAGSDMLRLKCSCGGSEMIVERVGAETARLTVPCLLCTKPHVFSFDRRSVSMDDCLTLNCPLSALPVCYVGEMEHVKAALAADELKLLNTLEENGVPDFKALRAQEQMGRVCDPEMLQSVLFVAHDLEEEGKIVCRCAQAPEAYLIETTEDGVRVACPHCGAERIIPADFSPAAYAFLDSDTLDLTAAL